MIKKTIIATAILTLGVVCTVICLNTNSLIEKRYKKEIEDNSSPDSNQQKTSDIVATETVKYDLSNEIVYELETNYNSFKISSGNTSALIKDGVVVQGELPVDTRGGTHLNCIDKQSPNLYLIPALSKNDTYTIEPEQTNNNKAYSTTIYAEDFFITASTHDNTTLVISKEGKIHTISKENTEQTISVCTNNTKTPWYNIQIEGTSTGYEIEQTPLSTFICSDKESEIDILLQADHNEILLDNIKTPSTENIEITSNKEANVVVLKNNNVIASDVFGYHVLFYSRGGIPGPATLMNVEKGEKISIPKENMKREGYIFTGWFKDEKCTKLWDFNNDTIEGDTEIYAGWEADPNYTTH